MRIFLNTKGTNDDEISEELRDFLHYVENTTDDVVKKSESNNIRRIHEHVCKIKANEEEGVKYMQAWEKSILQWKKLEKLEWPREWQKEKEYKTGEKILSEDFYKIEEKKPVFDELVEFVKKYPEEIKLQIYDYNGLNQLEKADTTDSEIEYTYDERGNQVLENNTTAEVFITIISRIVKRCKRCMI